MNIEKIAVEEHYVWVDKDAEIKEDCYALHLGVLGEREIVMANGECKLDKKIIAASPELNLKRVPSYARYKALEYSKPIEKEVEDESSYYWCLGAYQGFEEGYKAAEKEKSDELLTKYQEGMAKGIELCNGSDFVVEAERNRAIEFAKWISCFYSFGNISGLWYFHENTSKQYTEEELYELYLEQLTQGGNK